MDIIHISYNLVIRLGLDIKSLWLQSGQGNKIIGDHFGWHPLCCVQPQALSTSYPPCLIANNPNLPYMLPKIPLGAEGKETSGSRTTEGSNIRGSCRRPGKRRCWPEGWQGWVLGPGSCGAKPRKHQGVMTGRAVCRP